jgi:uncharacterized protein YbaP (TraB family)
MFGIGLRRIVAALLLLATSSALPAAAQGGSGAPRYSDGLFWRIEKPGRAPSHVYGTIHLGAPCEAYPREIVADRARNARLVMLELVTDATTVARMRAVARLPDDQRLVDLVGRQTYERLAAVYGAAGVPRTHLDRLPPWAAMSGLLLLAKPGSRAVDAEIIELARRGGRTTVALETVEEQVAFLDSFAPAEQAAAMRYALEHQPSLGRLIDLMLQHWKVEDAGALRRIAEGRHPEIPAGDREYQAHAARKLELSAERNRRMVDRAGPELDRGGVLMAIGALHLPGDDGVLALLAGRGFTIVREDQGRVQFPPQCSGQKPK